MNKQINWKTACVVSVFFIILSSGYWTSGHAQDPGEILLYEQNFESGEAPGWELEPGWEVSEQAGAQVLSGQGHSWARADFSGDGDYRLRFRLKLDTGRIHLVYRMNAQGRYFIGFDAERTDLNKQYWPETFLDNLASSESKHALGEWHQIEIAGEGAEIRLLINGEQQWTYSDPEPLTYGSFAFETLDNSKASIDDIQVYGAAPSPTPSSSTEFTWIRTGGPLGGLGYDVRMRSDNPDTMYVTDAWAGVFISKDGGESWYPSNQGISTRTGPSGDAIPVFCLTIDPHDEDTIWIGTQNVRGIFKSTDGGQSWVKMDHGVIENEGITFRGITVDPRDPNTVYAAAELASWLWNGEPRDGREFDMTAGVVYRTNDGGQNWEPIWRGDNLARYIWIDPRDSKILYISTGIFDREAANSDPEKGIAGGEGILKSVNGGESWENINQGLHNLYVGSLFMHPDNPDILLAGTGNNQYFQGNGVYLTTDGGASWQHVLSDDNINAVEYSLSDPSIAYAGSAGAIYRSDDGGSSWRKISRGEDGWGPPGVRAGFPIDFQVDPRNPDRIFANEYGGGNFVSEDGGFTWEVASQGYTGAQVRAIAVDYDSGKVYAAARSGLFSSENGGLSWVGLNSAPANAMEWYAVAIDPTDSSHLLASNNWMGQILESQDSGANWRQVSQHAGEMKSWRAIALAPSNPEIVYAGTSAFFSAGTFDDRMPAAGIYKSVDSGNHWVAANDPYSKDANVTDLAITISDPNIVYAATGNMGLLKSLDGGQNWKITNPPGYNTEPTALAVALHPTQPDWVYLGYAFGGLHRSRDGGKTWESISPGLIPEATVTDILFDPTDANTLYLSDAMSGVYRSTDGGDSWSQMNHGLNTRAVNKLAITIDGQHLYAATEGEGVYRLDLLGQPPEKPSPTETNPANEETQPTDAAATKEPEAAPSATPKPSDSSSGICGGILMIPVGAALITIGKQRFIRLL